MNYANLKKACEFVFLELAGSAKLMSSHSTSGLSSTGSCNWNEQLEEEIRKFHELKAILLRYELNSLNDTRLLVCGFLTVQSHFWRG